MSWSGTLAPRHQQPQYWPIANCASRKFQSLKGWLTYVPRGGCRQQQMQKLYCLKQSTKGKLLPIIPSLIKHLCCIQGLTIRYANMPETCKFCPRACEIVWLRSQLGTWFFWAGHMLISPGVYTSPLRGLFIYWLGSENFCKTHNFLDSHVQWACKPNAQNLALFINISWQNSGYITILLLQALYNSFQTVDSLSGYGLKKIRYIINWQ